jgi:hypothetical protein
VSPAAIEDWLKVGAAAGAAVASWLWIWAPFSRWLARRRAERARDALALASVRNLLDTVAQLLRDRLPLAEGAYRPDEGELLLQLYLIIQRREALYVADGHTQTHPVPRTLALRSSGPAVVASVDEVMRRTQRIQLAEERVKAAPLFQDNWTEGGDTR